MDQAGASTVADTITIDPADLSRTARALRQPETVESVAFRALLSRAEQALDAPLETVTAKTVLPPSGDPHDYMSLGSYWWPNPDMHDGLPYVRRDGERNPASLGDDVDESRLMRMAEAVLDLALAFHFTGRPQFAEKAAAFIRCWFLGDATRMNPHLRFAQSVPGVAEGRGLGIIDTRCLWRVIDAAILLEAAGSINDGQMAGLRAWFSAYRTWMHTHPQGHDEYIWHNNHGTYFDVQSVNYALFIGDAGEARRMLYDAVHIRMASQFSRDGTQPAELERTRPFHYSIFNLIGHLRLARYGEIAGFDYRNAVQDGRSLRSASMFMLSQIASPDGRLFPYPETISNELTLRFVLNAQRCFEHALPTEAILRNFFHQNTKDLFWLI